MGVLNLCVRLGRNNSSFSAARFMIGVWWLRSQLTLKNLLLSTSEKSFGTGYAFSLDSGHSEHVCCAFQWIDWCTDYARYCGCKMVLDSISCGCKVYRCPALIASVALIDGHLLPWI